MKYTRPDIPTALTNAEADYLFEAARGKVVVEFGSLLGFSTIVMAQSARLVIAVDPHVGYPEADPRPTYGAFIHHLETYGVRQKVVPVIAKGEAILPYLGGVDLVFIDTDDGAGVLLPQIWLLRTAAGHSPTVCVHDYGHKQWPKATRAVNELLARQSGWPFRVIDTLAIINEASPRLSWTEGGGCQ